MKKPFRPFLCSAALLLWTASPSPAFTLSDFDTPESVQTDPEDGAHYVTNINGGLLEKDGNGYISKISSNGTTVIRKFIGGRKQGARLDAPKGLAVIGPELWVVDIDAVKIFDKRSRKPLRVIDFSGWKPQLLNDLAVDAAGCVYVSDTLANRIFRIDPKKADEIVVWKEGPELGQPNGLVVNPRTKNLIVACWKGGRLLEIEPSGRIHVLKRGLYSLDGVDYDKDENLYVSNYERGEVYQIGFFGRAAIETYLSGLKNPADISVDRRDGTVLVPSFTGRIVTSFSKAEAGTRGRAV